MMSSIILLVLLLAMREVEDADGLRRWATMQSVELKLKPTWYIPCLVHPAAMPARASPVESFFWYHHVWTYVRRSALSHC
ncbi:hypothetical protein BZA77DRAFT_140815 [Pyronema omphalodes]|nr:hypothetical protein BZA77DRAFT_140815 [Pyronema omphalodes]